MLTPELLRQHTAALSGGALADRRLGSPGEQASLCYVAEQLEKAGLRPGGDTGFLQPVPVAIATRQVRWSCANAFSTA